MLIFLSEFYPKERRALEDRGNEIYIPESDPQ